MGQGAPRPVVRRDQVGQAPRAHGAGRPSPARPGRRLMRKILESSALAALFLSASIAWAKLPPPPPPDDKAKAAAEDKKAKDAATAEKAKADQTAAEDKA